MAFYGVPRSTRDINLLAEFPSGEDLDRLIAALDPILEFGGQVEFDTLTWGKRHVGVSRTPPPINVELFETFDDAFVRSEFSRRLEVFVPLLSRSTWVPTAEDVIIQKLRWGRAKDLEDARDVLAVQGVESLDIEYMENWCAEHGTVDLLRTAITEIPPLD